MGFSIKKRFWQHFPMVFPMAFPLGPSSQLFRTSSSKPVSSGATRISSSGSRESRQEARRLSRTWPAVRTGWQWNSWENHGKTMGNHGRCGDFMVILWWLMEQLWWLIEIQWESMFFLPSGPSMRTNLRHDTPGIAYIIRPSLACTRTT